MAEINKTEPNQFEQVGMNPFNSPTPGESSTTNKYSTCYGTVIFTIN